jgi:pyrroline-5-carboxylate reductase
MKVGFIGAGNMAGAMARGWGEPVIASDSGSGRAAALAAELGGEAFATNAEVAAAADVVLLCHKPAQLESVAREIAGAVTAVASVLGGTSLADLRAAYPGVPCIALMPNTPVEVGRGVVLMSAEEDAEVELATALRPQLERLGLVVELPEEAMHTGAAVSGVGPAYMALVVEALADAGVKHGLPAPVALTLATETMAGSAALLAARGHDTLALRRGVTSPGGTTARGLAALERGGLRAAFFDASDAVAGR